MEASSGSLRRRAEARTRTGVEMGARLLDAERQESNDALQTVVVEVVGDLDHTGTSVIGSARKLSAITARKLCLWS
jgi:hypothetical protein